MLKRGILLAIVVCFFMSVSGQEISHEVFVSAASVASGGGYTVSQTIGEPIVEYTKAEAFELTQGFQQPGVKFVARNQPQGNGVEVYPNPVYDHLTLEMFGEGDVTYNFTLFGLEGSVYYNGQFQFTGNFWRFEYIDVSQFKRGLYFVKVVSSDNKIARLFKIEKM